MFALDKLNLITFQNFALSLVSSTFVAGVVYGRAKVEDLKIEREKELKKNGIP